MITFKQQFTFNENAVKGFATFLGWQEKLTRQIIVQDDEVTTHFEDEEYDNPESFTEYVERKAVEHSLEFTKSWANKLKQDEIERQVSELKESIEMPLHTAIVQPVEDALISEIIYEE